MSHPYAAEGYLAALAKTGERVLTVEAWGGAVLVRPIAGAAGAEDACGAYPVARLSPEVDVQAGLDDLAAQGLISFVMVADPLSGPSAARLSAAFDVARPFKTHQLVDPARYDPTKHHKAEIRRARKRVAVEAGRLADHLPAWTALYAALSRRHAIVGPAAFPTTNWAYLAEARGLTAFVARIGGETAAMGLWFEHEGVAYNHLGASSAAGYAAGASYALYDAAIEHYRHCRVLNLGGGAGSSDDPDDGLARFKRGFATDIALAHLYGKVLDPARYAMLCSGGGDGYFPAYRG